MGATARSARWSPLCDIDEPSLGECEPVTFGTIKFLLDVLKIAILDDLIETINSSGASAVYSVSVTK
jgi:hypothetical protein